MSEITIESMQAADTAEAAAVLGDAFLSNPNSVAIWRRQGDRERRKQAAIFRLMKLTRPKSRVLIARDAGRIVGVLNMAPWPSCQMTGRETAALVPRMMAIVGSSMLRGAMSRAATLQKVWAAHDPREAHWHLGPVGVVTAMQGRGTGTRLMQRFCQLVDEDHGPAYLETDRPENVPFYERFGFQVVGEAKIHDVPNWFMWRDAR